MAKAPSETKIRLLETAHELIWRSSYGSVSVDGICEKANIKKGSFYHFFPSKAELALATIDWYMGTVTEKLNDIFSPSRHPIERFELVADYIYEKQEGMRQQFGQVCGCPFITLGSEIGAQNEVIGQKITSSCTQTMSYYESSLRDLIALNLISPETNVKIKAEEIYAFIIGQMMLARIKNDLEFIRNDFKDSLLKLIGIKEDAHKEKELTV